MVESNVKNITLGLLFTLFIGVIVAASLMPSIADGQSKMTDKYTTTNETDVLTACYATCPGGEGNGQANVNITSSECNFTLTNAPSGWETSGCPISSLTIRNVSGDALTITTDYNFYASTGVVQYLNTTATANWTVSNNISYLTYTHCDEGYITNSAARSVTSLILLFAALAIIAFAVYFVMKKLQEI